MEVGGDELLLALGQAVVASILVQVLEMVEVVEVESIDAALETID